jgi:hypothetical protein
MMSLQSKVKKEIYIARIRIRSKQSLAKWAGPGEDVCLPKQVTSSGRDRRYPDFCWLRFQRCT